MMQTIGSNSISEFLSSTTTLPSIIPPTLHDVCKCSLDIIENASSNQISAAVEFNQQEINKMLLKLLTINFISKNQQEIHDEVNLLRNDNSDNNRQKEKEKEMEKDTQKQFKTEKIKICSNHIFDLSQYCEKKLLDLSPIYGFSRTNYFLEYNISDDIRLEIISYLKPIEFFQSISLLNKQFNCNVLNIHESNNEKYTKLFVNRHFAFETFSQVKKYYEYSVNISRDCIGKVDWQMGNGGWVVGAFEDLNHFEQSANVTAIVGGYPFRARNAPTGVAPYHTVTHRPCNLNRFKNTILKRGYCNEAVDINLTKFIFPAPEDVIEQEAVTLGIDINDESLSASIHLASGVVLPEFSLMNSNFGSSDWWICGQIDFEQTYAESCTRIHNYNGYNNNNGNISNIDSNNNNSGIMSRINRINRIDTRDRFPIYQVWIVVNITRFFEKHSVAVQQAIRDHFINDIMEENNEQWLSVAIHGDDVENVNYFGYKSSDADQQLLIKAMTSRNSVDNNNNNNDNNNDDDTKKNDENGSGNVDFSLSASKQQLLDAIEYPSYCLVMPDGVVDCLTSDKKDIDKILNKWSNDRGSLCRKYEQEAMKHIVSKQGLSKIGYDEINDQLYVKLLIYSDYLLRLQDNTIPESIGKKMYTICYGCRPVKLVKAVISDARLFDRFLKEQDEKDEKEDEEVTPNKITPKINEKKKERYLEILAKWQGFIQLRFDVTKEFNDFQQRLQYQYNKNKNKNNKNNKRNDDDGNDGDDGDDCKWDNRKYFTNSNGKDMDYLEWDKDKDCIKYYDYFLLDEPFIVGADYQLNYFQFLTLHDEMDEQTLLRNVFSFVDVKYIRPVCKEWNEFEIEM